jgi:hypothetical protein
MLGGQAFRSTAYAWGRTMPRTYFVGLQRNYRVYALDPRRLWRHGDVWLPERLLRDGGRA